jgi:ribosomal protein S18 acetylase RimI-like enzyme
MELRLATESDLPALVRLNAEVQDMHARQTSGHFKLAGEGTEAAEMFRASLVNPAMCVVVAIKDVAVVGYFFASEKKRDESWIKPARRILDLEHIAVDVPLRRQGIGQALMERFLKEARGRGVDSAEICYWDFNQEAAQFYQRLGFTKIHSRVELPLR